MKTIVTDVPGAHAATRDSSDAKSSSAEELVLYRSELPKTDVQPKPGSARRSRAGANVVLLFLAFAAALSAARKYW